MNATRTDGGSRLTPEASTAGGPTSFTVVYNPGSGRGAAGACAEQARALLEGAGVACRIAATESRGHAEQIARQAVRESGPGERLCVVACGGDGTVQEVVNGLMARADRRPIQGVLRAGRCNDFARALGVPEDAHRAVDALRCGRARAVDLGRVGGRYFCTIAAVGFDAVVSRHVNDHPMRLKGTWAYVYATLRKLWSFKMPTVRLRGDFGEYRGPIFLAATANTCCYGGSMEIAPGASPFDGLLDVCVVRRIARLRVLRLLPRVMRGRHGSLSEVSFLETRCLRIESCDGGAAPEIWADGEPMGMLPAEVQVVPEAIRVMLPAEVDA